MPSRMGYVNVGVLLAVLKIAPERLELRIRPAPARLMFGLQNLVIIPADNPLVFPAHRVGQEGIELWLPGRPSHYFWTSQRAELLRRVAKAGFPVAPEERTV